MNYQQAEQTAATLADGLDEVARIVGEQLGLGDEAEQRDAAGQENTRGLHGNAIVSPAESAWSAPSLRVRMTTANSASFSASRNRDNDSSTCARRWCVGIDFNSSSSAWDRSSSDRR